MFTNTPFINPDTSLPFLVPAQFNDGYWFGASVAINAAGTLMASGSPTLGGGGTGSVVLYTKTGSVWALSDTITSPISGHGFGYLVTMSRDGTTLAVVANQTSPTTYIYVYYYNGSSWTLEYTCTSTFANSYKASVLLSDDGNTLIVGDPLASGGSPYGGAVTIHTRTSHIWTLATTIYPPGSGYGGFGLRVATNSTCSIVAISGYTGPLCTYVQSGSVWNHNDEIDTGTASGNSSSSLKDIHMTGDGTGIAVLLPNSKIITFSRSTVWTYQVTLPAAPSYTSQSGLCGYAIDSTLTKLLLSNCDSVDSSINYTILYEKISGSWSITGTYIVYDNNSYDADRTETIAMSSDGAVMVGSYPSEQSGNGVARIYEKAT